MSSNSFIIDIIDDRVFEDITKAPINLSLRSEGNFQVMLGSAMLTINDNDSKFLCIAIHLMQGQCAYIGLL